MQADTGKTDRRASPIQLSGVRVIIWTLLFGVLALWVSHRLGAFDLWSSVTTDDGTVRTVSNGFATVDHPFHTTRAETLRRSLADGSLLRWLGQHQGGYPVEFYPLGAAMLDVLVWAAALGSIPMVAAHKLAVIAVFLLPIVGFLLLAQFDGRSPGIALAAGAAHVSIRGWWWSGGSMELIEWGLVTNVAAATTLIICLPMAARFIRSGVWRTGAIASVLASFAILTNPRSGLALMALLAGSMIAAGVDRRRFPVTPTHLIGRAAFLVIVAGLLAAPEIVSLLRYEYLYYFVHYSGYPDLNAFWESSLRAVGGWPLFFLGFAGVLLAWSPQGRFLERAASTTAAIYVAGTFLLIDGVGPTSVVDQLEATRLMPFQRMLWMFLAASAIEQLTRWALGRCRPAQRAGVTGAILAVAALIITVLYVIAPPAFVPRDDRGLVDVATTASPGLLELEDAVRMADGVAEVGTALLVLGTRNVPNAWHDQLWGPLWSNRPFYYDDWLWYWQTEHRGDYDPTSSHAYRSDASALDRAYLVEHGIGAVVVTGEARERASREPYLRAVRRGLWDVYLVRDPVSIITISGNVPESIRIDNASMSATGTAAGGEIVIRRNWFPRWEAKLNGGPADIRHREDGYMTIAAPENGTVSVELRYGTDSLDWLARACALAGLAVVAGIAAPRWLVRRVRPRARSERR